MKFLDQVKIYVKAGEILKIERLENSKNKIEFKEILAYGDDKSIEVGSPVVQGAKVEAEVKDKTAATTK